MPPPEENALRRTLLPVLVLLLAIPVSAPAQEAAATRVPIADWTPLPAADPAAVPADVAAVRDQVLGPAWRDPEKVTLSWTGVSSFAAAVGGHVFLFDAWEIIGAVNDYLPLGREELAALDPEAVMVGHGHFDHAGDLGYVLGLSEGVVVGSEEHCVVAEQGAAREGVPVDTISCAITGTADTPSQGELQSLKLWEDVDPVTIMRHIHSAATEPGPDNQPDPFVPIMDPQPYLEHFQDDPQELQRFLGQQEESNEGGVWLFHLAVGDFTLLWGNSAGPIFSTPAITAALDTFPGCVDVMSNAILGFDQPVSGLQDPRLYVEAVHPTLFIPTHADAWAPVISAGQAQYQDELAAQFAELEHPPEVDFLLDPQDYLVPRVYDVTDPRWSTPPAGSSCAAAAPVPTPPTGSPDPTSSPDTGAVPTSTPSPAPAGRPMPVTGGGLALLGVLAAAAVGLRRRRQLDG